MQCPTLTHDGPAAPFRNPQKKSVVLARRRAALLACPAVRVPLARMPLLHHAAATEFDGASREGSLPMQGFV